MLAGSQARPECRPALSRRPANGRARKGRSAVVRAEEPEADLFRIQQELISQIEARKSRQADIEEEIKKNAAQRNGVSATIDLDEQYRKTLAKFKATPLENGSSSTANATLAPPPPATSLSKPAPASPASKPPAPPPSVQSKPMPPPSVPTVKPSQFSKPANKDTSASGMRPLQPLQPSGATMKPPPAAAPGSMSNAPMRPSGQEHTSAPRAATQSAGPKRNRPVVIPGKPTLPGAQAASAPSSPAPAPSPVSRAPAAPSSKPFTASPVPKASAPAVAPPAPKTPAAPPTPSITTPKPKIETTPTTFTFPGAPAAPSSPTKVQDNASRTTAAMLEELSGPKPTAAPPEPPAPPPAGDNVMNMVFVGAECAPWSKTGGLGDVMGSLPKAMQRRGHRVMVVAPRYGMYEDAIDTSVRQMYKVFDQDVEVGYFHAYIDGVDFVFVDHASYHGRQGGDIYKGDRLEQAFRNSLLCKAALEAVWHVPCGGVPYGDSNTVFIANDWHTSLLPVYLQAHYRDHGKMTYARSVLTIHNMAYQGRGPFAELDNFEIPEHYRDHFFLDDPVGGEHMNILKAAIITASRIVAVSGGYAWEIQTSEGGWGLHEVLSEQNWKLSGIVNGIDDKTWNPKYDQFLTTDGYTQYSPENLFEGKAQNKLALQRELGLPENPDVPMLGFIGRMDYQKGVDFIVESFPWLMGEGVQLVMLGSGREDLENELRNMENQRKDQCRGWVGFSVPMSHRITAACDMLLMPSRFEPCGLNQLYAMAYGTVPIVHAVGGLRETVQQFNPFEKSGTGWQFDRAESNAFRDACGNALFTYKQHRDDFKKLQIRGAEQDLSWDKAAEQYEGVFVEAKFQW